MNTSFLARKKYERGITGPLIIIFLGLVLYGIFWAYKHPTFFGSVLGGGASVASADYIPSDWKFFRSPALQISVFYPPQYSFNTDYSYTELGPHDGISGVKFTIPKSRTTGTNLSTDSGVSVEILPHSTLCAGTEFVYQKVNSNETLTERGVRYSVARSVGAAAGNYFEEIVYAREGSHPCTAVRYFIHSTAIANYEPGTIQSFDRGTLVKEFDAIRASLILERGAR